MKKKKSIYNTLALIFIIVLNPLLPKYIDNYYSYILVIILLLSVWDIYDRIQIRNNKKENQLRVPTNNDDYVKVLPFIFGSFLFFGGIAFYYYSKELNLNNIFIVALGFQFFIVGFLPVPTGVIEIKKGVFKFINGTRNESIKVEKIKKIEFQKSYILITDNNEEVHIVNYMNLIENDYKIIKDFLIKRPEITFEILP
jgi:hypothetical protein